MTWITNQTVVIAMVIVTSLTRDQRIFTVNMPLGVGSNELCLFMLYPKVPHEENN
jgi:hypothetical protein